MTERDAKVKEELDERKNRRSPQVKTAELYRGLKKSDYVVHMAKLMQKQRLIDQGITGAELSA